MLIQGVFSPPPPPQRRCRSSLAAVHYCEVTHWSPRFTGAQCCSSRSYFPIRPSIIAKWLYTLPPPPRSSYTAGWEHNRCCYFPPLQEEGNPCTWPGLTLQEQMKVQKPRFRVAGTIVSHVIHESSEAKLQSSRKPTFAPWVFCLQNDYAPRTEHLVACLETHKAVGRLQKLLACKMAKDS